MLPTLSVQENWDVRCPSIQHLQESTQVHPIPENRHLWSPPSSCLPHPPTHAAQHATVLITKCFSSFFLNILLVSELVLPNYLSGPQWEPEGTFGLGGMREVDKRVHIRVQRACGVLRWPAYTPCSSPLDNGLLVKAGNSRPTLRTPKSGS